MVITQNVSELWKINFYDENSYYGFIKIKTDLSTFFPIEKSLSKKKFSLDSLSTKKYFKKNIWNPKEKIDFFNFLIFKFKGLTLKKYTAKSGCPIFLLKS